MVRKNLSLLKFPSKKIQENFLPTKGAGGPRTARVFVFWPDLLKFKSGFLNQEVRVGRRLLVILSTLLILSKIRFSELV